MTRHLLTCAYVQVSLTVHSRTAHLVFSPAYVASYTCGVKYGAGSAGTIVPLRFTALVSGTAATSAGVSATKHVSSRKVQLAAGGGVASLGLLLGAAGPIAPLLGLPGPLLAWGLVDTAFWSYLAAVTAGLLSRQAPFMARHSALAAQVGRRTARLHSLGM